MQVPHNACVVVVDGRKSLFFRNEGDADYPNLVVEDQRAQADLADRDQKSDAAGRSSSPQGASQSSMGETDFHQQEEDRFAAATAELLKKRVLNHEFEALIVVAPPKTLGEMRKHYHKEVEGRIVGELAKDLTGHPVPDIEKALVAA